MSVAEDPNHQYYPYISAIKGGCVSDADDSASGRHGPILQACTVQSTTATAGGSTAKKRQVSGVSLRNVTEIAISGLIIVQREWSCPFNDGQVRDQRQKQDLVQCGIAALVEDRGEHGGSAGRGAGRRGHHRG